MDKVSIIMTTYNSIGHIETTLNSVRVQDYPELEIIICDGKSTDGTLDVIKSFSDRWPEMNIRWCSESDEGIYDAMNKGYRMSSGDIVTFFNDRYTRSDAVRLCVEAMNAEHCEGVHADLVYADGDTIVRRWKMGSGTIRQGWMPGHPTLFLRRNIYERYGLYRTDYKVSADYEFMVRTLKDGEISLAYVPETIISMYYGGTSTQGLGGYLVSLREGHRALKENHVRGAFLIDMKRTIRVLRQFLV